MSRVARIRVELPLAKRESERKREREEPAGERGPGPRGGAEPRPPPRDEVSTKPKEGDEVFNKQGDEASNTPKELIRTYLEEREVPGREGPRGRGRHERHRRATHAAGFGGISVDYGHEGGTR